MFGGRQPRNRARCLRIARGVCLRVVFYEVAHTFVTGVMDSLVGWPLKYLEGCMLPEVDPLAIAH